MKFNLSRRSLLTAGAALCASFLFACGGGNGGTPAATTIPPGSKAGKHLTLAFVTNNTSDFWTYAKAGVMKAKTEISDIDVDFEMPGDGQAATQKQEVEDLLVKGVDGIAISPIDPSNQTDFLNNVASKAVLVTQDSDAPQSNRTVYIGTDNKAAGVQAGELLKKVLPDGGKIMLFVGSMDAQNAKDRKAGLMDAIKNTKITVIDTRTDDTDRTRAKNNVQDTLVKYPDIVGLVGLWSYNGPAILSAVRDAKVNGKVKIVCFDEEADTLDGVKTGDISGTIVQQPFEFGRQSMHIMADYLRKDASEIPASKQIFIPTRVIDKDSVDDFAAKLKEYKSAK